VPIGFGTNVITATATAGNATGYAQVSVVGNIVGGTVLLDTTDPTGDDHGPGTYLYPTSPDFAPGSFDLTRFQVVQSGGTIYLRTSLAGITPTFGNVIGAQLLDIFVHNPAASAGSTAPPFASRNYTVDEWSQRLEVQGFAGPQWIDTAGNQAGTATVVASQLTNTITIAVPAAEFGTPGPGWSFGVVLTGQDGFSSDQARGFTPTPGGFSFGVCAAGNPAPICSVDPATVPKAIDVIAPAGVDQASELNPLAGPVRIRSVAVP